MVRGKILAGVLSQDMISEGIYSMWLSIPVRENIVEDLVPGRFVTLYCKEGSRLLPRPISICDWERSGRSIRLVYRIAGEGTKEFSQLKRGNQVEILGPLGNGFTLQGGKSLLLGGGIGIPPMLALAKALAEKQEVVQVVLGYRDKSSELFLKEELESYAEVFIATEDGSSGIKGNVIDAVKKYDLSADTIYACGPIPMLRGVKAFAAERGISAQISMEERMACGIGACLGCVCASKEEDGHSHVKKKRVCKDGPVFDAQEIEL